MTEDIIRHFTATGFVIHDGHVALHWHSKVKAWLPPGGHIEINEDPVQAVLREIREESGLEAVIVPTSPIIELDYPRQVLPPYTIEVEDIYDPVQGYHQHIDMIYICGITGSPSLQNGWQWVSKQMIKSEASLRRPGGYQEPPPKDVRVLAMHAFDVINRRENG